MRFPKRMKFVQTIDIRAFSPYYALCMFIIYIRKGCDVRVGKKADVIRL